jgi:hypothetical protein
MTNDKDNEDALTIAYLLGVKHGRDDALKKLQQLGQEYDAALKENPPAKADGGQQCVAGGVEAEG